MENDYGLDCCFVRDRKRFRFRAGAIIIEDGKVLLAKSENVDYYYSVGGGVHLGETSAEAVVREVFEETGVRYEIDRLAFIHENIFRDSVAPSLKGLDCHEISFYYIMKPRGIKSVAADWQWETPDGNEHAEFVPLEKLKDLKVFPKFFKDRLFDIPNTAQLITDRD